MGRHRLFAAGVGDDSERAGSVVKKMYRWMVAIDGSENAREAFYTALSLMDKRRDELFIVTTVQTSPLPLGRRRGGTPS